MVGSLPVRVSAEAVCVFTSARSTPVPSTSFAASNLDLKSTNCLTASDAPVSPVYLANRSDGAALSTDMSAATSGVAPTPSRASAAVSCHLPSVRVLSGGRAPTFRPPGWFWRL